MKKVYRQPRLDAVNCFGRAVYTASVEVSFPETDGNDWDSAIDQVQKP